MGVVCERDPVKDGNVCRTPLHIQLKIASLRLRHLAQEMIRVLEKVNSEIPYRIPEAYAEFYRAALMRLDGLDLEKPSAFGSVNDIAAELMGVHQAVFAMYFDPARATGKGGMTAPMALN